MLAEHSRLRRRVRALRARLGRNGATSAASVLFVPVPEADFVYACWPGDRSHLGVPGLPLHVTVLYPFIDAAEIDASVEHELANLAQSRRAFDYELARVGRFPGVLYLAPVPGREFIELTREIHARWPSHPPYGGAYDEIVPHVTLALGREPRGLQKALEPALPVRAVARELLLLTAGQDGRWSERARFPLGR